MSTDTDHEPATASEDLDADTYGEGHHGATDRQYILIAADPRRDHRGRGDAHYIDFGPLFLPALLILMVVKFFIVVSYFMHLKFDNKLFSCLFYTGLSWRSFVYCVALATFHFFS